MIEKARQVCGDYPNVEFQNVAFKDFHNNKSNNKTNNHNNNDSNRGGEQKYDAIIAASSLHWALAEEEGGENDGGGKNNSMIRKLHSLLNDEDGAALLLFWNFPPVPDDNNINNNNNNKNVLDTLADALNKPKPFYFGNGSQTDREMQLATKILSPLTESGFFGPFDTKEMTLQEEITITAFLGYLQTLSNYITMEPPEEKQFFFDTTESVLRRECGETVKTTRKSILNISYKK